jgi:hypothetical protein
MSLSDLASIGSLVSGAAVLGSLIYLALQVRQTDRNQQASIRHGRITRVVDMLVARADPELADAWRHGLQNPDELTQTELTQFLALCTAMFAHLEDSFFQHEEGLLNEDAFAFVLAGTRSMTGNPGFRVAGRATCGAYMRAVSAPSWTASSPAPALSRRLKSHRWTSGGRPLPPRRPAHLTSVRFLEPSRVRYWRLALGRQARRAPIKTIPDRADLGGRERALPREAPRRADTADAHQHQRPGRWLGDRAGDEEIR